MGHLSKRCLRGIVEVLEGELEQGPPSRILHVEEMLREVQSALTGSPKKRALQAERRKRAQAARVQAAAATGDVYRAVAERAGDFCECGCGQRFSPRGILTGQPEMDHFLGRARAESLESCWLLRWDCHRTKTLNRPSRAYWLRVFLKHCQRHGYTETAKHVAGLLEAAQAKAQLTEGLAR